jgi:hypothetical protein
VGDLCGNTLQDDDILTQDVQHHLLERLLRQPELLPQRAVRELADGQALLGGQL